MRRAAVPWLLLAAPLAVFLALFVAPLVNLLVLSFFRFDRTTGALAEATVQNYVKFITDPFYLGILWRTLKLALLTTASTLVLGYPVAYHLTRCSGRKRAYLTLLIVAPLLVSVVVRSFGWLVILGPNGLVNSLLTGVGSIAEPLRLLYTETAIVVGLTHVFLSFMVLSVSASLGRVDPALIRAAQNLGASERQLIRHVLIPSALTWIFSSLHVSIGLAIIAVVVGEYLGASRGIGYVIAQAEGVFDTTGVFAGMAVLSTGVLLVGAAVDRLERRLLRWKPERADAGR